VFRYTTKDGRLDPAANVNGSADAIAGVCNAARNVVGLMPIRSVPPSRSSASADGRQLFEALARVLVPVAR
jgi:phosphoribosylformylglycinamidine synthase